MHVISYAVFWLENSNSCFFLMLNKFWKPLVLKTYWERCLINTTKKYSHTNRYVFNQENNHGSHLLWGVSTEMLHWINKEARILCYSPTNYIFKVPLQSKIDFSPWYSLWHHKVIFTSIAKSVNILFVRWNTYFQRQNYNLKLPKLLTLIRKKKK